MNLMALIQSLHREKEVINRAIADMEELLQMSRPFPAGTLVKRRGRKSMSSDERQLVSARIKKYWAAKRKEGA